MTVRRVCEGAAVGEYRLVRLLGAGGFGEVWLAEHLFLPGRRAALKIPLCSRAIEQLRRDGIVQARLDAPEIVRVAGMDLASDPPHVAYEYVEGGSLGDRLPLQPETALGVLADVAAALAHAHGRGILHLDLKPANILIDAEGRARVTDFGLGFERTREDLALSGELESAAPAGTLAYMAPEQRVPGPVDARADVFAFGIVLFEALTGRLPTGLERLAEAAPGLPASVADLYERCCAPLERRLPDGAALCDAIRAIRAALRPRLRWRDRPPGLSWRDRDPPGPGRAVT